jgi:putative oxidoreductase
MGSEGGRDEILDSFPYRRGLGTRAAAAFVLVTMSVAAFKVHAADPLNAKELALAYWTMAGALILIGGGKFSLDAILWPKLRGSKKK